MPAQDFFKVYADPRFRILTPEDKRLVLEGKLNLDQIIDLRDADVRYRDEVMSKQNAPQSPQEAPQEDSIGLWERMNPEGYKKAGATLSGFGDYAVGGAAKTIGGVAFSAGELAPMVVDPIGTLANIQDTKGGEIRSPLWTQVGRDFADTGRFDEATKTLRQADIQEGDILESVAKTGASVAPMAGAALTRSPSLGAAVMGGFVFGQEYLEGRDELKLGKAEAAKRAGVQGIIELLTERVGLGAFYKGGLDNILTKPLKEALEKNYGSKLAGTILANVSEELAATELQIGADEEMGYRTYTPEQKAQARMDAAVGGIVMGGGIGTVTSLQRTPSIKTGDPAIDSGAAAFAKAQEEANKRVFGKAKSEQSARDTEWAIDQSIGESIRDEMIAADSRRAAAEKLANANRIQDIFTGEETTVPTQEQRDARAEEARTPERQAELEKEYLQKKSEEAKAKKATKKVPEDSPRLYDVGIPEGASPQMAEAFRQAQIRRSTDVRGENIYPNIRQPIDVAKEDAGVFEPTKPQTKEQKQDQQALPLKESTDVRPSEEYQPTLDKQQMAEEDKARAEELTNDIKKYENHLKRSKFPEAKQKWTRAIALAQSELDLINQRETTNAQDVRKASGQVPRRGNAVEGSQGEGSPNLQQQEPGRAGDGGIRGEPVGVAQDEVQRAAEEDVVSPEELQQTTSRIRSKTEQAVAEKTKAEKRSVITKTLRDNNLSDEFDLVEDEDTGLNGRFNPETNRLEINLNSSSINAPEDVKAVAVHEISHSLSRAVDQGKKPSRRSLSGILGSQNENIVNQRIRKLAESSPLMREAVKDALASKNPEKELLSYALERVNRARAEGKPLGRRVAQFVKDVVSYVKVGLSNAGLKNLSNSFNENDLYRLGQLMVKEQKVTKPTAEQKVEVLESRSRPAPEKEQKKVLEPRGKEPLKQTRATPDSTGVVSIFDNLLGKSSQETTESLRKQSLKKGAGRVAGKAAEATKSVLLGTEGKKMEIKSIEDIAQGLTNLASIKAANLHKRLENTFHKVVAKGSQPEVLRKLSLASDKKKEVRNEARAWLRDNYPDVHDDFMAFRHAIKLNSLQYIDSILSSGKPLTRRDIAVITEIEKNLDSYITRSYRALSSDPKIKKAWVKNMKKAVDARDRGETLNEAQQKLVNVFDGAVDELKRISLSIGDYVQDAADVPAGFKKVSLARTIALADAWLGNKAPPAPVGMTAEESEQYVETVNRMLEAKKKELEDAGMYDQALDGLAKSVAKEIVGILDKPGEIAKEYLSNVNDLTTIKKKTDITEPLRKLLGEISNPLEQLQITAMIQGEFLATANMQKELYEVGLDRGWFSDTRSDNAYTTQFKGERFGVLDGVWTTKEIHDQIAEPIEVLSFPVKMLARLNSLSKAITIKYNPANPITNFVGASVFTYAQNGYVPINPLNLKEDISSLVKAVEASYGQLYAADAEHLNRWAEEVLAVSLGDQVNIAELQADARKQLRDEILAGKAKTSPRRKVGDFATWLNAQSDKLFVYHAYFKEQAFLTKYYEAKGVDRTPAQIQREASERIKQSNITPERAPKIVRQAERFGLTRFMRYFAETARSPLTSIAVAANDINNAIKDRKDGNTEAANMLMRRGLARLSGSAATLVFNQQVIRGMMSLGAKSVPLAVLGGLPLMVASLLAGEDPEEVEKQKKVDIIRKGLALDRQGKDYSYFGVDDDGNHILVERDRINPIDTFTAVVKSVMGGDWERAKEETAGVFFPNASTVRMLELAAPLISHIQGKEFKTKQEPDWAKSNPELYSALASIPEETLKRVGLDSGQIKRGTDFILRQLEPYTVRPLVANAQSMAEEGEGLNRFDRVEDAMASLGFYMMRFNPIRNMENTAKYEYDQVSRDAWKEIKDTISKLDISDDRIVELYVNRKKQEMEAFDNVLGSVQAAQGLKPDGISETEYNAKLLKSLTEAGVQKDKAASLLKGVYEEGIYSERKWADSRKEAVRRARTTSEREAIKRRYDNLKRVINDLGVK